MEVERGLHPGECGESSFRVMTSPSPEDALPGPALSDRSAGLGRMLLRQPISTDIISSSGLSPTFSPSFAADKVPSSSRPDPRSGTGRPGQVP